jgi:hypothetical protein
VIGVEVMPNAEATVVTVVRRPASAFFGPVDEKGARLYDAAFGREVGKLWEALGVEGQTNLAEQRAASAPYESPAVAKRSVAAGVALLLLLVPIALGLQVAGVSRSTVQLTISAVGLGGAMSLVRGWMNLRRWKRAPVPKER